MSELTDAEARVKAARDELREAEKARRAALLDSYPFKVGDVVEARSRTAGWQPALVRGIEPYSWGPVYKVSFRNKTGEWSKSKVQRVWSHVRKAGS